MTEIEDQKTFWNRSTMEIITFTDGTLADIIQLARREILSLITTIESQKEEIKKWRAEAKELNLQNAGLDAELEGYKAVTELAVKG